jgi:hypothetical protein
MASDRIPGRDEKFEKMVGTLRGFEREMRSIRRRSLVIHLHLIFIVVKTKVLSAMGFNFQGGLDPDPEMLREDWRNSWEAIGRIILQEKDDISLKYRMWRIRQDMRRKRK